MKEPKRLLQIFGKDQVQIDTVVKAVKYTAERDMKYFRDGAIKVDLEGKFSIKQIFKDIF